MDLVCLFRAAEAAALAPSAVVGNGKVGAASQELLFLASVGVDPVALVHSQVADREGAQ